MTKTTVYLPDDLKRLIELAARRDDISEAEVIRRSLAGALGGDRPTPHGGLFSSSEPFADRVDDLLVGFGEDG